MNSNKADSQTDVVAILDPSKVNERVTCHSCIIKLKELKMGRLDPAEFLDSLVAKRVAIKI